MIKAMDTETFRGRAILITTPGRFCEPKSWDECMDFLAGYREMACYNMDYDGQAIFKYLPRMVRNRLALLGQADHEHYVIRYVKKKFTKVWYDERLLFVVYDMAQFYNCPLAVAAKNLGIDQKHEIPKTWYSNMLARLRDPKTRETVINYALQDAHVLQQIIDKTVVAFKAAGMEFTKPYSNASFAERVFRDALRRAKNKREIENMARKSYNGGKIECLKAGFFKKAYYYDIHSAYPSAIANLVKPDGKWITDKEIRSDAVYAFVDVTLSIPKTIHVGPIPLRRSNGAIYYPVGRFRKTITLTEFRYVEAQGWVEKIHKAVQHIWPKYNYPFAKVRALYLQREANPEQSYAIKIVLNSVYGKTAQVLKQRTRTKVADHNAEIFDGRLWRTKEKWKDHTSFVYAAEITARIRMKVYQDAPPNSVIFYATDGVMCTSEIPIPTGPGLGDWSEVEEVRNLIVVGSGVYQYDVWKKTKEGKRKNKTVVKFRGFSPRGMDLRVLLKKAGRLHHVNVRVLRNTSLRQAVMKPEELNVLRQVVRVLNVNFDTKRYWPKYWNARDLTKKSFESEALIAYPKIKMSREIASKATSPKT